MELESLNSLQSPLSDNSIHFSDIREMLCMTGQTEWPRQRTLTCFWVNAVPESIISFIDIARPHHSSLIPSKSAIKMSTFLKKNLWLSDSSVPVRLSEVISLRILTLLVVQNFKFLALSIIRPSSNMRHRAPWTAASAYTVYGFFFCVFHPDTLLSCKNHKKVQPNIAQLLTYFYISLLCKAVI